MVSIRNRIKWGRYNPNIKQLNRVNKEKLTKCDKTNSRVDEQCPRGWCGGGGARGE